MVKWNKFGSELEKAYKKLEFNLESQERVGGDANKVWGWLNCLIE
jgi:hypothetical protein